jgi:hypothetical protein
MDTDPSLTKCVLVFSWYFCGQECGLQTKRLTLTLTTCNEEHWERRVKEEITFGNSKKGMRGSKRLMLIKWSESILTRLSPFHLSIHLSILSCISSFSLSYPSRFLSSHCFSRWTRKSACALSHSQLPVLERSFGWMFRQPLPFTLSIFTSYPESWIYSLRRSILTPLVGWVSVKRGKCVIVRFCVKRGMREEEKTRREMSEWTR